MARIKIKPGCRVRLRRDVHLRSGRIIRAGVLMTCDGNGFSRGWSYFVWVRGRKFYFKCEKKNADHYFELVSPAPKKEDDVHLPEEGSD